MSDCSVFYYVNGDPLDGEWIDLDKISSIDDVLQILAETRHIPYDDQGNPDYGGDLLVADTDGDLAHKFYAGWGSFDLEACLEALDSGMDEEIMVAYMDAFDEWNLDLCECSHYGWFKTVEEFAEHYIEQAGLLNGVSENMKYYFDYEKYAKDELLMDDFKESNGHYFYSHNN